jgi:SAM-dependent MidA family methyltransferase
MQEGLYHPLHGYYASHIKNVGKEGDFSTSATLDPQLGKALAVWIIKRARQLDWRRIPVIEIGAGSGALARSLLRHLDWKTRWRIDYRILETSPVLQKLQKNSLSWHGVRWIRSLPEELVRTGGKALIFSNELVDAFPCRLFQNQGGSWHELGVKISEEEGLSEVIVGKAPEEAWFQEFSHLPEGQRLERHDSYRDWLGQWSRNWKEGFLLTIDYGDLSERLYDRRPGGSLRAYYRHQRFTGSELYARFGKQDLTADVNFSDLMEWGSDLGWKHSPLLTQHDFVRFWMAKTTPLQEHLLLPTEAGEAFKVLEQYPGRKS